MPLKSVFDSNPQPESEKMIDKPWRKLCTWNMRIQSYPSFALGSSVQRFPKYFSAVERLLKSDVNCSYLLVVVLSTFCRKCFCYEYWVAGNAGQTNALHGLFFPIFNLKLFVSNPSASSLFQLFSLPSWKKHEKNSFSVLLMCPQCRLGSSSWHLFNLFFEVVKINFQAIRGIWPLNPLGPPDCGNQGPKLGSCLPVCLELLRYKVNFFRCQVFNHSNLSNVLTRSNTF